MRAVWVDEQAEADYGKAARHKLTRLYFSARRHSLEQIEDARQRGFVVGIYRVPEWDVDLEPTEWAELLSDDVARLHGNGRQLAVQANVETHNTDWLIAFWTRWRQLRPTRATSWALEGIQGGRLGQPASLRKSILSWRVRLVPEAYQGDMTPLDPVGVKAELVNWGFPGSIVSPFYDAAHLPAAWDGFAFTQARLP